jgi:SAM-dependent methyltransferase
MKTQSQHQAAYWDKVAVQIAASNAPEKDLVGYHSPYDCYVRRVAVALLDRLVARVPNKRCIAELGSGAGLNLRYMNQFAPEKLLAFDCSANLLALAKANLSDLNNVTYIHTDGNSLPVPQGDKIDLLYTLTVLQHIVHPEMFSSVVAGMRASQAEYILIVEDTKIPATQPTPDYTLRTPLEYQTAFGEGYTLVASEFVSLTWAARLFGVINRMSGLYRKHEGAAISKPVLLAAECLSPLAKLLDQTLQGSFGMTALLFKRG